MPRSRPERLLAPWPASGAPRYGLLALLLVGTLVAVSVANPAFASWQNLRDLLERAAPVVIVGCAMTFVILTGEIDISVGSLLGLLAAVMGILASPQHLGLPVSAVIAATLLAGAVVGLMNGLLVALGRVPSIIATLDMLTVLRGATEALMGGQWITDLPSGLRQLGTGRFVGIPVSVWTAMVVAAAAVLIARRSRLGLCVYAVGGNPTAAAMARVSVRGVRILVFMMTGVATAVAALVTVPQQSVVEAGIGTGLELVVITAVVVGGTSIRGGHGGVPGTLLAALLFGSIGTALIFLKLGEMATYWERAIQGAFILGAVLIDHLANRRRMGLQGGAA